MWIDDIKGDMREFGFNEEMAMDNIMQIAKIRVTDYACVE